MECSYDGDVVEEFTAAMTAGGSTNPGFTMGFWAKPTGLLSLSAQDNLFNPSVTFFGKVGLRSLHLPNDTRSEITLDYVFTSNRESFLTILTCGQVSPPQSNLGIGLWASNHYGEARFDSACDEGSNNVYDNVPHPALSTDEWSFVSVSRNSATAKIEVQA